MVSTININIILQRDENVYIYVVYIYYKHKIVKNGDLSYGYPMGMLWLSCGNACLSDGKRITVLKYMGTKKGE